MPNDFPKWRTVYEFYRKWISIGFFLPFDPRIYRPSFNKSKVGNGVLYNKGFPATRKALVMLDILCLFI